MTQATATYTMPTLRKDDKGLAVRVLQQLLNLYPFPSEILTVDGSFGNKTKDVVIQFQAYKGLAQDGIVGPITWDALTR